MLAAYIRGYLGNEQNYHERVNQFDSYDILDGSL